MVHSLVHSSIDNYPGLLLVNILLQKSVTSSKKKIKMRKKHILLKFLTSIFKIKVAFFNLNILLTDSSCNMIQTLDIQRNHRR